MNNFIHFLMAVAIGIGATALMDLWSLFLKNAFNMPLSDYCLVGRWLCHMRVGIYQHRSIANAAKKPRECLVGWTAHYVVGVLYALFFVVLATAAWLDDPTPLPAIVYGLVTVVFPFFVMQPAFGQGRASAKTLRPAQARFRTLLKHGGFGAGLYISALVLSQL